MDPKIKDTMRELIYSEVRVKPLGGARQPSDGTLKTIFAEKLQTAEPGEVGLSKEAQDLAQPLGVPCNQQARQGGYFTGPVKKGEASNMESCLGLHVITSQLRIILCLKSPEPRPGLTSPFTKSL